MDLATLARYPIMPGTAQYLKENDIVLEDLISSSAYGQARDAGRNRVMEALVDGEIREHPMASEVDRMPHSGANAIGP